MSIGRVFLGSTVAVLAVACFPAVANAAPVNPGRALLSQSEFPAGTFGYEAGRGRPSTGLDSGKTPQCAAKSRDLDRRLDTVAAADARAGIGSTTLLVYIVDQPLSTAIGDVVRSCDENGDMVRVAPAAIPADLRRLSPFVLSSAKTDLQGWVDVRGVTVSVNAFGPDRGAADTEAFWQTLRAQVAKVERQP